MLRTIAALLFASCALSGCLAFEEEGLYACGAHDTSVCTNDCWCVDPAIAQIDGSELHPLCGTSDHDMWTGRTAIEHWDGTRWSTLSSDFPNVLDKAYCPAPGEVVVAGDGDVVVRCTLDGCEQLPAPGATSPLHAIGGFSANDFWVGSGDGALFHWNGNAWDSPSSGHGQLAAIWGDPRTAEVFALSSDGLLRNSNNWAPVPAIPAGQWSSLAQVLDAAGKRHFFLGAFTGDVAEYNEGTGALKLTHLGGFLTGIAASGLHDAYAVSSDGVFQLRGDTWGEFPLLMPVSFTPEQVWSNGPGDVWVNGTGGTVIHFHP